MKPIRYYESKISALQKIEISQNPKILCNRGITKYFSLNSHEEYMNLIQTSNKKDFYEFIPANTPVCFFYDIEIYENHEIYNSLDKSESKSESNSEQNESESKSESNSESDQNESQNIVDISIKKVVDMIGNVYPDASIKKIILESHSDKKKSFHIIFRIKDSDGKEIVFKDVSQLKDIYKAFGLGKYKDSSNRHLVDPSVYREGLFRTLYSSKNGENRPLKRESSSDNFDDIQTFVTYISKDYKMYEAPDDSIISVCESDIKVISSDIVVNNPEELDDNDKAIIKKFIQKEFHHFPNKIRDVFIDKQYNCIIVSLIERYCPFLDKEHRGNNQYVVLDT